MMYNLHVGGRLSAFATSTMLTITVFIPFPLPSTWKENLSAYDITSGNFNPHLKKWWNIYLGNQTGHFVAIELIWNTAVDVDRHFGLLVALSIRWRDLWLQLFGIFCLEKTWWHKRLQEFSVSDMKKFSPLRLWGSCLYAIFPQYRYQWLRNSSAILI